jgi:hypothetical protein
VAFDVLDYGLDVEDHAPVKVLHAAGLGNVARDAEVEEDVVHVGVLVWVEAAENNKTSASVDGLGDFIQAAGQVGKGEGVLVDIIRGEVAREGFEVRKTGFNLEDILRSEPDDIFILRLEVGSGP